MIADSVASEFVFTTETQRSLRRWDFWQPIILIPRRITWPMHGVNIPGGKFRWGIQILKNCGVELKPILKKNGLFCL